MKYKTSFLKYKTSFLCAQLFSVLLLVSAGSVCAKPGGGGTGPGAAGGQSNAKPRGVAHGVYGTQPSASNKNKVKGKANAKPKGVAHGVYGTQPSASNKRP